MNSRSFSKSNKPSKYVWWIAGILISLLLGLVYFNARSNQVANFAKPNRPDAAFASYVTGYTGGTVSKKHNILVRLAVPPQNEVKPNDPVPAGVLSFSPSIKGKAHWIDERTIEFIPENNMASGQLYQGVLHLDKLIEIKDKKLKEFKFHFQIISQSFEVLQPQLVATGMEGLEKYTYTGKIITADESENEDIEKLLKAKYLNQAKEIKWEHHSKTEHEFTITDIERGENDETLLLLWNGKALGLKNIRDERLSIPAKGVFKLLDYKIEQTKKQEVHFTFSDPINKNQDLDGLVRIEDQVYTGLVQNNKLIVSIEDFQEGKKEGFLSRGIENIKGDLLSFGAPFSLEFRLPNPEIKFVNEGNILPSTDGAVLPFEAIGLKSVLLRVIKIEQDRIGQFLQVNDLDGSSQLNRVGRPVLQKIIRLDNMQVDDLSKWNRFTLEFSKLVKTDPGAIYQISLMFSPADVLNGCGSLTSYDGLTPVSDPREEIDMSNFEDPDSYFYDDFGGYYDSDYDWQRRNDPCNSAFYSRGNNVIKQNVLTTDIGLMAKRGADNSLLVVATDLISAQPLNNAAIKVYNFQLQEIAQTYTAANGMAQIYLDQKPFLIKVNDKDAWSYLKLVDGRELSVSQFDVSGQRIQKGLKGFIYGDRGVWRPGDSLFLSFILEDKTKQLPPNHPVIFELSNPRGMVVERMVSSSSVEGLYAFRLATEADAPTGNWRATIQVGGATFSKNIPIETVKPNRLKIDLEFPDERITPKQQSGDLKVRWLSGAIASNLRAQFDLILRKDETVIKGFEKYHFDNAMNPFTTEDRTVFDGFLDGTGNAKVNSGIKFSKTLPATLSAYFAGKVFEPGGNFSIHNKKVTYYPYSTFIGFQIPETKNWGNMLDLGKNYKIPVVTVDVDGNPQNLNNLQINVYKMTWRWWWDAHGEDAYYTQSEKLQKIYSTQLSTKNGKGSFDLKVDNDWGRYFIEITDPESGYTAGEFVYFEWPSYGGSKVDGMPGGATNLAFTSDKTDYKIGEQIQLYIPGGGEGQIFISVENGTEVLETHWLKEQKGTNTFTLPVTEAMAPNVYLNVATIQPHGQTVNDLPIRQYGVLSVNVENPETVLHPVINMPEELKPNQSFSISIKEKQGKAMAYTIAVVDEGLLGLTNFKTPQPHQAFYAKEALGVKTWDVFDQVIGAYGGRLERLLSIGGDGYEEQTPETHNVRFQPVVKFLGPFFLKKGATQTHQLTLPNYVGEVRTMVIAEYQGAYGSAEKSVAVKQPLMILPTLPRVTGPEEEIILPVNVFAMKPSVKDVEVKVSGDSYFKVVGESTKRIRFNEPGNDVVMFKVKVGSKEGIGKIKVTATGNGNTTTSETNLEVRNPNPPQTKLMNKTLAAGETWDVDIDFFGMPGTNSVQMEVAGMPSLNLNKRVNYLTNYPYGCLEQRVSTVFPQLYLNELTELSTTQKNEITEKIKAVIREMSGFQHNSGGLTYWPGTNYPDDWTTSYAGNFLIEAEAKGFDVPWSILQNWVSYQKTRANSWKPSKDHRDDFVQAYRLYTLALANKTNLSAMNRLRVVEGLGNQAKWALAAAYGVAGRKDVAEELVNSAQTFVAPYREMFYTYGSEMRDEAFILQTLVSLDKLQEGFDLANRIAQKLSQDTWLSTQETSFSLMAMAKYYQKQKGAKEITYSYQENAAPSITVRPKKAMSQKDLSLNEKQSKLSIKNLSDGDLYIALYVKGIPVSGHEVATSNGLNMKVKYTDMKGVPLQPEHLRQGQDFIAEVTVQNPGLGNHYRNMALTQIFPSGWEIRNTRFEGTSTHFNASIPTYQDIRDDRVYTYFDLNKGEQKTFRILLNATYAGKFYLPAIRCSAMYDEHIQAVSSGKWIEIKEETATNLSFKN